MTIQNKKLFIFDLDGTLVDTAPDFKNSINYMLNELNESEVSLEEIRNWVGYGARELIRRTVVDKNIPHDEQRIEEMLKIFLLHYTHNIDDDSVLFNNVRNVLEFLKDNGIKLAVCTNKMERLSNILLEKLNVLHMFDYLVGGDSLSKSKPDPFPLLNICEKLNTEISDSIMIGDSVTDLNAGKGAGMPVVLVSYGYTDNKDIYNEADLVINDFSQLKELVN
ncbi:MAG: phosphoglycolate phosphatase [Pelagibacteraceae bacterium]|nr:phosphoglycolate phosphatase [Pelagibacteraceae bacterium]|tara:strand:- start:920 stop:1585 length:666 start_codon:yes stop_codon:yes gene_type:complete